MLHDVFLEGSRRGSRLECLPERCRVVARTQYLLGPRSLVDKSIR